MYKIVASAIGAMIFGIVAMAERAPAIEGELTSLSRAALKDAKLKPYAEVSFDGRDGTITGYKSDEAKVEEGAKLVRNIYGVRVVDVVLKPNPTPDKPGQLELKAQNNTISLTGVVTTIEDRQMIVKAVQSQWPSATVDDQLKVNRMAKPLANLKGGLSAMPALGKVGQLTLKWTDSNVRVEGNTKVPQDKQAVTKAFAAKGQSIDNAIALLAYQSPQVSLQSDKDTLVVSGKVASNAQKKDILGACRAAWPKATIKDQLIVDPTVQAMDAKWTQSLGALSQVKQLKYNWTPNRLVVGGWVETKDAQTALQERLKPQSKVLDNQTMVTPKVAEIKKAQRDINQFLRTKLISFETGSDVPTQATVGVLQQTAELLKQYPNTLIEVHGHTDNQGKPQDNKVLSQKRADAVVAQLTKAGVQRHRLFPIGFGDTKPIASNKTPQGRAKNRRVVFFVKGAQP